MEKGFSGVLFVQLSTSFTLELIFSKVPGVAIASLLNAEAKSGVLLETYSGLLRQAVLRVLGNGQL